MLVGELAGQCVAISFPTVDGGGCSDSPGWGAFRDTSLVPLLGPWSTAPR